MLGVGVQSENAVAGMVVDETETGCAGGGLCWRVFGEVTEVIGTSSSSCDMDCIVYCRCRSSADGYVVLVVFLNVTTIGEAH